MKANGYQRRFLRLRLRILILILMNMAHIIMYREMFRHFKCTACYRQAVHPVYPEYAEGLPLMAIGNQIPFAEPVDQPIGINMALLHGAAEGLRILKDQGFASGNGLL